MEGKIHSNVARDGFPSFHPSIMEWCLDLLSSNVVSTHKNLGLSSNALINFFCILDFLRSSLADLLGQFGKSVEITGRPRQAFYN